MLQVAIRGAPQTSIEDMRRHDTDTGFALVRGTPTTAGFEAIDF